MMKAACIIEILIYVYNNIDVSYQKIFIFMSLSSEP